MYYIYNTYVYIYWLFQDTTVQVLPLHSTSWFQAWPEIGRVDVRHWSTTGGTKSMALVESLAEAMVVTCWWHAGDMLVTAWWMWMEEILHHLGWYSTNNGINHLKVGWVSKLGRWWFVINGQTVCAWPFSASSKAELWSPGEGEMDASPMRERRNECPKADKCWDETQLKIGTKPMKMLLRFARIQKGWVYTYYIVIYCHILCIYIYIYVYNI